MYLRTFLYDRYSFFCGAPDTVFQYEVKHSMRILCFHSSYACLLDDFPVSDLLTFFVLDF
jgi:hypothetical protein